MPDRGITSIRSLLTYKAHIDIYTLIVYNNDIKYRKLCMKLIFNPEDTVHYDSKIDKDIAKLPAHIIDKLKSWAKIVNHFGIMEARKCTGYHDEPLQGERKGQRSIRLNKAYRAIYIEDKKIIRITVIEVNKHEY